MRKQLLILLSTLISIQAYSQIIFEHGYFIDESDQKIECLIKNVDWNNNPKGFEYKLSSDGATQHADIQTVKEFVINDISKYIRANVKIDRSSGLMSNLSYERQPVFEEEQLFLKVLVDGKASLFQYTASNLIRFFYQVKDSEISQLVYKKFMLNHKVAENNYFRQQLINDLKDQPISNQDVERIKYSKESLTRFFLKYNQSNDSDFIYTQQKKQKRDLFNLTVRPGITFIDLNVFCPKAGYNIDANINTQSMRFGLEAEIVFPFNKNKWSIIVEPTYQYCTYEQSPENLGYGESGIIYVDYKSIEIPVGMRYYIFLNKSSKIFANVLYVPDFSSKSSSLQVNAYSKYFLNVQSRGNFGYGAGYTFKNKYSIEVRYQTKRDVLHSYQVWSSNYNSISLNLGYTLF